MKPESRVEQRWRYGLMLAVWLGLGMLLLHSVEWGGGKAAGVAVPNWRAAPPGTGPTQPPWGELEFIDLPLESLEAAIRSIFARKGEEMVAVNLKAFHAGRSFAEQTLNH